MSYYRPDPLVWLLRRLPINNYRRHRIHRALRRVQRALTWRSA